MTREELLNEARRQLGPDNWDVRNGVYAAAQALYAIACILLAREQENADVVKAAEEEAKQMVAAQYRDELAAAKARIAELEGVLRDLDSFCHFDRHSDYCGERMYEWRRLQNRINVALGRKPIWSEVELTPPKQ